MSQALAGGSAPVRPTLTPGRRWRDRMAVRCPAVSDPGPADLRATVDAVWAMQLILRVERAQPPSTSAACMAVASAVARLLADARSTGEGVWAQRTRRWAATPRKVVRRARGAAWERCLRLDGVSVECGGAEVHALPPGPVHDLPPEVTRLQVGGTDLDDPDRRRDLAVPPGWPGLLVAVTPEVSMTAGKAAAQCGHAAELALAAMGPTRRATWAAAGFPVDIRFPDAAGWAALRPAAPVEVCDAGHTEVPPAPPPSWPRGREGQGPGPGSDEDRRRLLQDVDEALELAEVAALEDAVAVVGVLAENGVAGVPVALRLGVQPVHVARL